MLLLVIDAELDQLERGRWKRRQRALERFIDMRAISADLVERRAAEHAAARALRGAVLRPRNSC